MKAKVKNFKNLMMGLMVSLPVISFASGDISVVAEEKNDEMEKIKVEVPTTYDLDVSIQNGDGEIIYFETLKRGTKKALIYNLSNLEDGRYILKSEGGHQTVIKDIEKKGDNINVVDKAIEFEPLFKVENDLLKINYCNEDLDKIKVSVENSSRIFYEKEMGTDISFDKIINISSLHRGSYYVTLEAGDDQHKFYFDVF